MNGAAGSLYAPRDSNPEPADYGFTTVTELLALIDGEAVSAR